VFFGREIFFSQFSIAITPLLHHSTAYVYGKKQSYLKQKRGGSWGMNHPA
jgi:hypothetical protein